MKLQRSLLGIVLSASAALVVAPAAPTLSHAHPASAALESVLHSPSVRFLLAETVEGRALSSLVLRRPVQTDSDLRAFLTRLESVENLDLAKRFEARVRAIESDPALRQPLRIEARAALLRDSARQHLSFEVLRSGEIQFVELHGAKGSLRENISHFLNSENEGAFEPFMGGLLPVHRIPPSAYTDRGTLNLSDFFKDGESLALAISEKGDFSIIAGEHRYVGTIMETPHLTSHAAGVELQPGMLIRFPDVSKKTVAQIVSSITAQPQSMTVTCVNGTCAKLKDAGIVLGGDSQAELPLYRTEALDRIIRTDFQTPQGAAIPFEIYLSSDRSFQRFFQSMRSKDLAFRRMFAELAANQGQEKLMKDAKIAIDSMTPEGTRTLLSLIKNGLPEVIIMPAPMPAAMPTPLPAAAAR